MISKYINLYYNGILNSKKINMLNKPIIIAEIWCNHMWKIEIAKELIDLAKQAKATYVKFQKRNNKELLTEEQYNTPHPVPSNSYWDTYWEHREFLEFSLEQHKELYNYCKSIGIWYSTSVWDIPSAKEIISINPDFIKIPSACNNNFEMLELLIDDYKGDIHISFWMTTREEEKDIVWLFEKKWSLDRLIIYSCTSWYPVPFEDVCMLEIKRLKEEYWNKVKGIWFSWHHLWIAIDNCAIALWANTVERHFTKDRTWKWTDHAASLEFSWLSKLVRDLNASYSALNYKKDEVLPIEKVQRDKLKFRKN